VEYALLGRTGLRVSRIALGTAVFGVAPVEEHVDALVHSALDIGVNLFDCANTYGNRGSFDREGLPDSSNRKHAEELLGRALRHHRNEIVLSTKVSEAVSTGPNDGGKRGGLSRFHIMGEVERSLSRLATDHVDILHLHHPDPDTPIDETLRAVDDLVRQGKVRYLGLSNFSGWQLTQATLTAELHHLTRPILNQVPYNLINRGVEAEVVPAANALGLSVTCFSPLAGGALAGDNVVARPYSGYKRWGVKFNFTEPQRAAADALNDRARLWGHTPGALAMCWLLSQPGVAAAIIGPETPDELLAYLAAFDARLSDEQLAELDAVGCDVPSMPL
jgi:1-deoxyxylulose-5-phosphate synthase